MHLSMLCLTTINTGSSEGLGRELTANLSPGSGVIDENRYLVSY